MYWFAACFKYKISNIRNKTVASSVGGCIYYAPTTSHIASTLSILLLIPSNKSLDVVQRLSVATCLLVLLNLSSALDTVDHTILPQHIEHCLGLTGTVFIWLSAYIRGQSSSMATTLNLMRLVFNMESPRGQFQVFFCSICSCFILYHTKYNLLKQCLPLKVQSTLKGNLFPTWQQTRALKSLIENKMSVSESRDT